MLRSAIKARVLPPSCTKAKPDTSDFFPAALKAHLDVAKRTGFSFVDLLHELQEGIVHCFIGQLPENISRSRLQRCKACSATVCVCIYIYRYMGVFTGIDMNLGHNC